MYNFSGVWFRIWGVCGFILLIGIVCILIEKPWTKKFKLKQCKVGIITIIFAIFMSLIYASRIIFPNVSLYTGEFVEYHRNARVAPPLPITYEYVFGGEEGERKVFYLDIFSKKDVFPLEFENGQKYIIYFDEFTDVILKVEVIE